MAFHDSAIVGYAETKIVEKSDKDVCALGAEILGSLIKSTGIEKDAIDGMILSSSMTSAGSVFWSQLMADALGLIVTAEGIEDENQVAVLRLAGCSYFQGFLFARPMPSHQVSALLAGSTAAATG